MADTPTQNISAGAVTNVSTPVDPTVNPVTNPTTTTPTQDQLATTPKDNTTLLSNDVTPRVANTNEEGLQSFEDFEYKSQPVEDQTSQLPDVLKNSFSGFEARTGRKVQVFNYNPDTRKADIRIEGYNARETQQVVTSDPKISSLGRDDFRDLLRVGFDLTPIRDRYCFNINGNRVEYYD